MIKQYTQMLTIGELWESKQEFFEHFLQLFYKLKMISKQKVKNVKTSND